MPTKPTRREVLQGVAAGSLAAVSGCLNEWSVAGGSNGNAFWRQYRGGPRNAAETKASLSDNPSESWRVTLPLSRPTQPTALANTTLAASYPTATALAQGDGSEKWSRSLEARDTYHPASVGGRLFPNPALALNHENGSESWHRDPVDLFDGGKAPPPITSPTVANDTVYGVYMRRNAGSARVAGLDVENGERTLSVELAALDSIFRPDPPFDYTELWRSAPAVADGTVYVGGFARSPLLAAVDVASGSVDWRFEPEDATLQIHTCPVVEPDADRIFLALGRELVALDTSGEVVWRFAPEHPISRAPTIADGKLYVVGTNSVTDAGEEGFAVAAIDAEKGEKLWTQNIAGGNPGWPVVAGNVVIVTESSGSITALATPSGEHVWEMSYSSHEVHISPPAVADGRMYFVMSDPSDPRGEIVAIE